MEALQGRAGTLLTQAQQQENLTHSTLAHPLERAQTIANTALTGANTISVTDANSRQNSLHPGALAIQGTQVAEAHRANQRGQAAQPYALAGINREGVDAADQHAMNNRYQQDRPQITTVREAEDYLASIRSDPNITPNQYRYLESLVRAGGFSGIYAPQGVDGQGNPVAPVAAVAAPTSPSQGPRAAGAGAGGGSTATPSQDGRGNAPAAIAAATGSGGSGNSGLVASPTGSYVESIPLPETRNYVDRIQSGVQQRYGSSFTGTIDQVVDAYMPFLVGQESGGVHTNADGTLLTNPRSGAAGVTQVMRRTGEDPGYGVRPLQNQSREEYMRFGRDYFRAMLVEYGGNVELALAAYNAGPGKVNGWLSQGQVTQIARNNAGVDNRASRMIDEATGRRAANNSTTIAPWLSEAQARNATPDTIVRELAAGPLAEMSRPTILRAVTALGERGVPPAVAGAILARNPRAASTWLDRLLPEAVSDHHTIRPNNNAIDLEVRNYLSGNTETARIEDDRLAKIQADLTAARARMANARQLAEQAARRAASDRDPRARERAAQTQQDYRDAARRLEELVKASDEDRNRPVRPPPSGGGGTVAAVPGQAGAAIGGAVTPAAPLITNPTNLGETRAMVQQQAAAAAARRAEIAEQRRRAEARAASVTGQ
jgi:hypothetical protein